MNKIISSLITLVLLSGNANALDCSAKVLATRIMKSGIVELKMDGDVQNNYINICNVAVDLNGVSPEVCKSLLSLALTAKATGKNIKLWNVEGGT
jgi:hypothetical protein